MSNIRPGTPYIPTSEQLESLGLQAGRLGDVREQVFVEDRNSYLNTKGITIRTSGVIEIWSVDNPADDRAMPYVYYRGPVFSEEDFLYVLAFYGWTKN